MATPRRLPLAPTMTKTTIKASSSSSSPTSTYLSTGALCCAASPATLYCAVLLTSALYHLTHRHSSGISIHLLSESTPTKSGRGGYRLPLCVPALPGASSHHDRGSLKYRNINLGGATLPENELLKQWEWMMRSRSCAEYLLRLHRNPRIKPRRKSIALRFRHDITRVSNISRGRRGLKPTNMAVLLAAPPAEVAARIPLLVEHQASRLRADNADIILMPVPARYNKNNNANPKIISPNDEEEELPLLEFGVAAVEVARSSGDEEVF
ncbi:hypothetical protein B0H19DRAFT_1242990 [Mycena capillaripes]|nr:hypothetical protein B0H19DRAFT_1242990 [Mycena capillaripes]